MKSIPSPWNTARSTTLSLSMTVPFLALQDGPAAVAVAVAILDNCSQVDGVRAIVTVGLLVVEGRER